MTQDVRRAKPAGTPGDPLEPATRAIVDLMSESFPAIGSPGGPDAAGARAFLAALPKPPAPEIPVARVADRTLPGPGGDIAVRIYRPAASTDGDPLPVVVFYHGGGWVLCGLDSHDRTVRQFVTATGAVFVSVDYRLAPETRFPGPAEDAYAAYTWVRENAATLAEGVVGDPARVAVAGDSAGGNLAAAVCLMAKERGVAQPAFQLLVYPVLDSTRSTPSYEENATGFFLTADHMRWYWEQYLGPDGDGAHPWASPVGAKDLAGLAPAFLAMGRLDPLRDEGVAYARRLEAAGVPAAHRVYDGLFHGAIGMGAVVPAAVPAFEDCARALRDALA